MKHPIIYLKNRPKLVWRLVILFLAVWVILVRLVAWVVISNNNSQASYSHFQTTINNEVTALQDNFEYYVNTLYAGQALFSVDNTVSRQDWTSFIDAQYLTNRYPGVYGLSYVRAVSSDNIPSLLAQINSGLLPGEKPLTSIYPSTSSSHLAVVTYIAPDTANQSGIGYNILSDPTRATAINEATITGLPTATARVIHLQGDPPGQQQSIIIFLPVYNNQQPISSATQRQGAVQGYVDILLHIKPLLNEVFSSSDPDGLISVQIQNGGKTIYSNASLPKTKGLESKTDVIIAGQTWHVTFEASQNYGLSKTALWLPRLLILSELPMLSLFFVILYLGFNNHKLKKLVINKI